MFLCVCTYGGTMGLFLFKDVDSHYKVKFLGVKFSIRHKCKFKYKKAENWGLNDKEERNPKIIISLTSFPKRIKTVHLAINTLLRQTMKPDKIILWLSNEEFQNGENDLPNELIELKKLGLEIMWCNNLGSYKKLVPTLKMFPNDIIITADDDIYYDENLVSDLYASYLENKNCIIAKRVCKVSLKENILSAKKLEEKENSKPDFKNLIMGGAGCLFPPNSLHKDVFDKEKILNLIPTHDDIYFWAMAVINNKKIKIAQTKDFNIYTIDDTQKFGLCKINKKGKCGMCPNIAFEKIAKEYPILYKKIESAKNA